jgi:endogenous inhibitor of DNA gyrase (YacG/DUF329 family)
VIFCIELDRRNAVLSFTMPPRWIVTCPECKEEFTHTHITKIPTGEIWNPFTSPPKPQIPEGGTEVKCQNCGKTSTYQAFDLIYRAD